MATIARGHAALACSFIVPQKPQLSFWVEGIMMFAPIRMPGAAGAVVNHSINHERMVH